MKPLAIDLFCGLGGWSEGLLAEGFDCIGFDIERHDYGTGGYPAQLVLQDVLTIHGRQFRDAALIVASPPCQEYSYMAMPWSLAKQKRREYLDGTRDRKDLTALFDACFRIQREASEAAGHHIPLVVENVRGACEWVGRSRWNYGSFHLWGDVPALMPMTKAVLKGGWLSQAGGKPMRRDDGIKQSGVRRWNDFNDFGTVSPSWNTAGQKVPGFRFDGSGKSFQTASVEETGVKAAGMNWSDPALRGQHFTRIAAGQKNNGGSWFNIGSPGQKVTNQNPVHKLTAEGIKGVPHRTAGHWTNPAEHEGNKGFKDFHDSPIAALGSKSKARKAASAAIAKVPLPLARWIAQVYRPCAEAREEVA